MHRIVVSRYRIMDDGGNVQWWSSVSQYTSDQSVRTMHCEEETRGCCAVSTWDIKRISSFLQTVSPSGSFHGCLSPPCAALVTICNLLEQHLDMQLCLISFVGQLPMFRNVKTKFRRMLLCTKKLTLYISCCPLLLSIVETMPGLLSQEFVPTSLIVRTFRGSDLLLRERGLGLDWLFQVAIFAVIALESFGAV